MDRLRCSTPTPPWRAIAIAMRASVTVSIAEETSGIRSVIAASASRCGVGLAGQHLGVRRAAAARRRRSGRGARTLAPRRRRGSRITVEAPRGLSEGTHQWGATGRCPRQPAGANGDRPGVAVTPVGARRSRPPGPHACVRAAAQAVYQCEAVVPVAVTWVGSAARASSRHQDLCRQQHARDRRRIQHRRPGHLHGVDDARRDQVLVLAGRRVQPVTRGQPWPPATTRSPARRRSPRSSGRARQRAPHHAHADRLVVPAEVAGSGATLHQGAAATGHDALLDGRAGRREASSTRCFFSFSSTSVAAPTS